MRRDGFDESDNVMSLVEMLGLVAALLTTLCWIPQALKTIRTRDTRSISLVTQGAFALGIVLWLAYGLLRGDLPLILANAVSLILVGTILLMKLRFG
jgi:MtN3 and saliva related transmembrane protein